jgi:hypothetical protein
MSRNVSLLVTLGSRIGLVGSPLAAICLLLVSASPAGVNAMTGIVQMDAVIGTDTLSAGVGLPDFFGTGASPLDWYSQKTARRVEGFLDVAGLTLQPLPDGSYRVVGVAKKNGRPSVAGVEPGDVLLEVGGLKVTGATMGTVVDALRGTPGQTRTIVLERSGRRLTVQTGVVRFL